MITYGKNCKKIKGGYEMLDQTKEAESALEKLLKADENQLYEQLGIRAKAIAKDISKCSTFDLHVTYDQAEMGLMEDVKEFGKRFFHRCNVEAYKIICGSESEDIKDREALLKAFSISDVSVATVLATLLVTNLGLAPAIAAVVAAIMIKRFFRPSYVEFCQVWKKKLPSTS
jgi:hypothetical protein